MIERRQTRGQAHVATPLEQMVRGVMKAVQFSDLTHRATALLPVRAAAREVLQRKNRRTLAPAFQQLVKTDPVTADRAFKVLDSIKEVPTDTLRDILGIPPILAPLSPQASTSPNSIYVQTALGSN